MGVGSDRTVRHQDYCGNDHPGSGCTADDFDRAPDCPHRTRTGSGSGPGRRDSDSGSGSLRCCIGSGRRRKMAGMVRIECVVVHLWQWI